MVGRLLAPASRVAPIDKLSLAHGGELVLESSGPGGSTFTVTMPRAGLPLPDA